MKITKALLIKLNACEEAMQIVNKALPCNLSTDPENNIDLAIKLADLYGTESIERGGMYLPYRRALLGDLYWLAVQLNLCRYVDIYGLLQNLDEVGPDDLVLRAIQAMAIIADG